MRCKLGRIASEPSTRCRRRFDGIALDKQSAVRLALPRIPGLVNGSKNSTHVRFGESWWAGMKSDMKSSTLQFTYCGFGVPAKSDRARKRRRGYQHRRPAAPFAGGGRVAKSRRNYQPNSLKMARSSLRTSPQVSTIAGICTSKLFIRVIRS